MNSDGPIDYNPRDFPDIAVTVDVVLFAIRHDALHVLLIKRGEVPFHGDWALPGGFVVPEDEDLERAAERELKEETDVDPREVYLEQLGSYGARDRDSRLRVVTVAYWGACSRPLLPAGGGDAAWAEFLPVSVIESGDVELAFDHGKIVADALARLRAKLEYTAVATRFCETAFTITELRRVYEVIWNRKLDAGNFQRKVRQNRSFRQAGRAAGDGLDREPGRAATFAARTVSPELPEEGGADRLLHGLVPQRAGSEGLLRAPGPFHDEEVPAAPGPPLLASVAPPGWSADESEAGSVPADAGPMDASVAFAAEAAPAESSGRKKRVGRPASLWSADDPSVLLNSPIVRPRR